MSLADLLLDRGQLSPQDHRAAEAEQLRTGDRMDRVLLRLALATREQVLDAISRELDLPIVDLDAITPEPAVLASLPPKLVFRQRCVPISQDNGTLTVATSDPYEASTDELRLVTGKSIALVLADEDDLQKFIRTHYGVGGDTLEALSAGLEDPTPRIEAGADDLELAQEASVIKLVNDVLAEAIAERATDVHIEPYEHELIVRYRIDGVLQKANVPPTINRFGAAIISRLKIMANLNIAEKRRPQDGRITFKNRPAGAGATQEFDLRVSVIPLLFGEGVVLRVLSKTAVLMSLNDLGMPEGILARWDKLIARPHGILLVTGPTGSGKSTTLYASLHRIVSPAIKIITVEDPVEYHVPGVNQIQVNHKVGLDFSTGLRSILRHDPDVVLIGEIRDKETAETAVQASLTGHLVFSTLHTNDAAGSTTRLLDMGVEPFLVSSSVEGIMAQRLVRRLCKECSQAFTPEPSEVPDDFFTFSTGPRGADGKSSSLQLKRAVGCKACRNTGYKGRVGVYELLSLSDHTREMIMHRANSRAIAQRAREDGDLSLLIDDGYTKVREGLTTLDEVASALVA
jgi:general secretion pathway protein E/type IV pilus assembly protein PilB